MSEQRSAQVRPLWVSPAVRELANLPEQLLPLVDHGLSDQAEADGMIVAGASEVIGQARAPLPKWVGADTFYLVFMDVPIPALMRLPTLLGLHKPDQRLHVTEDRGALRRLLIAQSRRVAAEGIVDAYVVREELVLLLGDLTVRSFPKDRLPDVADWDVSTLRDFEIDPDGSFLRWSRLDLDLDVSALLQAVDPMYLADVEIERISREDTGAALRAMREERGLRQKDISGLGERQVRRLEKGTSRLTLQAAREFASSFDLPVDRFLEILGERLPEQEDRQATV